MMGNGDPRWTAQVVNNTVRRAEAESDEHREPEAREPLVQPRPGPLRRIGQRIARLMGARG
jgi:hypothetical protein